MEYDIIFISGETFFDHPLSGIGMLKRLLEHHGYKVGIVEKPRTEDDLKRLGKPKLFFGVSSGNADSMVKNYTPLKKKRIEDPNSEFDELIHDRAVTVYCNWIRKNFRDSIMVIGGTEASLRRFTHYDYWQNRLRKSILLDSRADILVYGNGEKQILEIAKRIKEEKELFGILGTCVVAKEIPTEINGQEIKFKQLPTDQEITGDNQESKEKFCDMQLMLNNHENLAQNYDTRYVLQFRSPEYTSKDLDEYYSLPFSRRIPTKRLRGFEFSVVTHRGCVGNCSFCAVRLIQGDKIISRSEESILKEIETFTNLPYFKGNVDDLGGPSANMYGMDCNKCRKDCIDCNQLDKSHSRLIKLLKRAREVKGIKNVYIRSGIRYDLAPKEYIKDVTQHHLYDTLRIAPEHVNKNVLELMNKNRGNLKKFIEFFNSLKSGKKLSYYFITAHPGSSMKEAKELGETLKKLNNVSLQVFTPTPMTMSTCMYYTGMNPLDNNKKIYVPYSYREKKDQKNKINF